LALLQFGVLSQGKKKKEEEEEKRALLCAYLEASRTLHGVSLAHEIKSITGLVPALQHISTGSGWDVAIWKHTLSE